VLSLMIALRADWKRAEQSAARFQVAIAAAQCGAVSGVRHAPSRPSIITHRMGDALRGPGAPFGAGLFPRPVAYFEI
jgi:hypothetical protein